VSLLALTFAVGIGSALGGPAFQSSVSEVVPEAEIPSAVSLNSAGFNLARAVGPAVGGLIVAQAGAGVNFVLNALSFVGVILVLFRWRETARKSVLPAERFVGAMRAGVRYVVHDPALRTVLVRTAVFIIPGSAIWALLPRSRTMLGESNTTEPASTQSLSVFSFAESKAICGSRVFSHAR
jgi:MFS family permease